MATGRLAMEDRSNTGFAGEVLRKTGFTATAKGEVCPFTGAVATRPALG